MATTREHEQEIARLQGVLGERLAHLETLDPAAQEYDPAADDVIAAAEQLVGYEARVPQLLDEEPRRVSLIVLRGCGTATMVIAAALALSVVPGGRPWWWLPIAVVLAAVGARLLTTRVRRDSSQHLRQRIPAALIAAGAVCAAVGQVGLVTAWALGIAALLVAAGLLLSVMDPAVQVRDLSSGQPLNDEPLDGGA